MAVLQICK